MMETTPKSGNDDVATITSIVDKLKPARAVLFKIFSEPELRPPIFDEMREDLDHVIRSIARIYTDSSCVHLHEDELYQQGWYKVGILIDAGILTRLPTRCDFFKMVRTSVNNHVRGIVQRHRFTIKRTGIKPPPKEQRNVSFNQSTKPIEISLNDEEAHLQVGEIPLSSEEDHFQVYNDVEQFLLPVERLVLKELIEHSSGTMLLAELDSWRGDKKSWVDISVKPTHMAQAIGLSVEEFKSIAKSASQKLKTFMEAPEKIDNPDFNRALSALESIFQVQVPRHFDSMVIRRLFTMVARREFNKVTPEVKSLLLGIGAKVPEERVPGVLRCFGVLYKKGDRTCESCGLKVSCATKAANFGLDKVVYHPSLLGTRQTRVPMMIGAFQIDPAETPSHRPLETVIQDSSVPGVQAPSNDMRNDEVLHFLQENFSFFITERASRQEMCFKFKDSTPSSGNPVIFCAVLKDKNTMIDLRFCKPSSSLKPKLRLHYGSGYLPAQTNAQDAIDLVNQHAKERFV